MSILEGKYGDLLKRIFFTIGALVVYRIGAQVPIPGVDPFILAEFAKKHMGGLLGMLDMFSGGSLGRFTIFALNLAPYITASIIIQLATMTIPQLEALKKDSGPYAKKLINKYTKYLAIIISMLQSYMLSALIMNNAEMGGMKAVYINNFQLIAIPSLTAGTFFLIWLAEQITTRGISNGSSLIIFAGIIANLPASFINTFELGRVGSLSLSTITFVIALIIGVTLLVVFIERSYRKLVIHYPKRASMYDKNAIGSNQQQHLPFKLNSAGVIPPIFAGSLLAFPVTIISFMSSSDNMVVNFLKQHLAHGQLLYMLIYVSCICLFAFVYTSIQFNPTDIAEHLKKSGGFIPGLRPGQQTAEHIDFILTRLTVLGAVYLSFLCVLPEFLISYYSIPFYFGGTSILIIVGATMDTATQIKSHLITQRYSTFLKGKRR